MKQIDDLLSNLTNQEILIALVISLSLIALVILLIIRYAFYGYQEAVVDKAAQAARTNAFLSNSRNLLYVSLAVAILASLLVLMLAGPFLAVLVFIFGLLLPPILSTRHIKKRREQFVDQFPDALMSLSSSLKSGTSLARGIEFLSQTQPRPFKEEMTLVLSEYNLGQGIDDALKSLEKRIPTPEVELFTAAITISQRVGGNLSETLESLAETLKEKANIEGKIRALTAQGRMQSVVMILLPVLLAGVLYFISPKEMDVMFSTWTGWLFLGVVFTIMLLAYLWIRKIVNIDV